MAPLNTPIEFVSTFTRYTATEVIGEGGTGRVYKATSEAGDLLAIKVLDPAKASKDRRRRFQNELTFGLRNQHKNVLTVLDHGPIRLPGGDTSFYVMPLYDCSLRKLLETRIPKTTVLPLFSHILDGVEAAHLQDVVHRDLKPENILLDSKDNRLVVADFGIAEFSREDLYTAVETHDGTRLANFEYAAPEQRVRGGHATKSADIFALGLMLNEMFTGRLAHGTGYVEISSIGPELAFLDELVEMMIRQRPDQRPAAIDVVKRELEVRHNDFIERQRLSELRQVVIPLAEIDDRIALDPIRVVGVDWESGVLTLKLSQPVNADWVQAIQFGPYSRSSVMGKGPESFQFRGDTGVVPARDVDDAQRIVDYFKTWLGPAHQIYVEHLRATKRDEEERQRKAIEREIAERETRRRVLTGIKL